MDTKRYNGAAVPNVDGGVMKRTAVAAGLTVVILTACGGSDGNAEEIPSGLQPSTTTTQSDSGQPTTPDQSAASTCTNLRLAASFPADSGSLPRAHIVVADGTPTWVAPLGYGSVTLANGGNDPSIALFDAYDAAVMLDGRLYVGLGRGSEGAIAEVDVDTGEVVRSYPVPGRYVDSVPRFAGLTQGLGWLWTFADFGLVAVNPDDGSIVPFNDEVVIELPGRNGTATLRGFSSHGTFTMPVEAGGRMWVANDDRYMVGLGLDGSHVLVETGETSLIPVEAEGLLYLANFDSGTVTVVDPDDAVVVDEISVGNGPLWPTEIDGRLWFPNSLGSSITVVNSTTGGIDGELQVGAVPSHPIPVGDYVVVVAHAAGTITVFDRDTLEVRSVISVEDSGVPADSLLYPSGHVDSMPQLRVGLPVEVAESTIVVPALTLDDDGRVLTDLVAVDLPSARVVDRYPGVAAVQPIVASGSLVTTDGDSLLFLECG